MLLNVFSLGRPERGANETSDEEQNRKRFSAFFPKNARKILVAQILAFYAQSMSMRHIDELTGILRNTVSKYIHGAEPVASHRR